MSTIINATTTTGVVIQPDNSGSLVLQTNSGTTALTIDTSQNLQLGNASASLLNSSGRKIINQTGSILQVVSATYNTQVTNSTSSYVDTGLTATITPSSTSSKILILLNQAQVGKEINNTYVALQLLRGATVILTPAVSVGYTNSTAANHTPSVSAAYLDSPATASAVTYKTNFNSQANNAIAYVQLNGANSTLTLLEIAQ